MCLGGHGGVKPEGAALVVKVKTAEEVREYTGAFLQLYREEAFYLERTVHYLQRVGMEHIKKAVLEDPARRQALNERLQFSLSFEQDPWKERLEQPLLKKEFDVIPVKQLEVSL
jgi:nitrite reductase (NADH) large subunit